MKQKIILWGSLVAIISVLSTFYIYQYFNNRYLADQVVMVTGKVLPSMTLTNISVDSEQQNIGSNIAIEAMVGQKITFSGLMPANVKLTLFFDKEKFEIVPDNDGNWSYSFRPDKFSIATGDHGISYFVSDDQGEVTPIKTIGTLILRDNTFYYNVIRFIFRD